MRKQRCDHAGLGRVQILRHTRLAGWQCDLAAAAGLVPAPDIDGRWSVAAADDVRARRDAIVEAVGTDPPVGGHRAAERLSDRTGAPVDKRLVEKLVEAGALAPCGEFEGWPLYHPRDLDAVPAEALWPLIRDQQPWLAASAARRDAPRYLRWRPVEFERIAEQRDVRPGPYGRYALADLDALAADPGLDAERLLLGSQAAARLGIRWTEFAYLVGALRIEPCTHTTLALRSTDIRAPLYRVGDVDALLAETDVDWDALRRLRPGQRSPLRALARRRPETRATVAQQGGSRR